MKRGLKIPPPESSGRAFVVHPVLPGRHGQQARHEEDRLNEACGLAHAIWLEVIDKRIARVSRIAPGYLLGKGVREEIAEVVAFLKPDVVIINHALTPVQQSNLEKEWKAKVIDRTGLILEIFGERAQTREGKIQVELAALEYRRSRLVRTWTHLERQRGGGGFMGGPGEKQMELDRRLLDSRIATLKRDLGQVHKNRELQRRSREKVPYPIVALIGYTNAGKSTLFNRLTGAGVFAEDLLFATLDPTLRHLKLPNGQDIILTDTVGFISDLPTHLIAAFRATLEQVQYADVIAHVRDFSTPDCEAQKQDVIGVLADLGIDYEHDARIVEVFNKIDALSAEEKSDVCNRAQFQDRMVAMSALTGEGADTCLKMIQRITGAGRQIFRWLIPLTDGEALAWLYNRGKVIKRHDDETGMEIHVELDPADKGRFTDRFGYTEKN